MELAEGGLRHTIRHADGSWQPFGNVERHAGNIVARSVECAAVNSELHVCAVNKDGSLLHTIRHADGSWERFGNVQRQTGSPGFVSGIACADVNGELHICAGSADFSLWHTIRYANGHWKTSEYVRNPSPPPDDGHLRKGWMGDVACAAVNGELHLCICEPDGFLGHTIRYPTGSWLNFGDVKQQIGDYIGYVSSVACATVNAELHVYAIAERRETCNVWDGLWGTIRYATGSWQHVGDVRQQAGDKGPLRWDSECVACATINGELHLCAVNRDASLWHTIRHADGSWLPFRNVGEAVGDRRYILGVALANVNNELHVCIRTTK